MPVEFLTFTGMKILLLIRHAKSSWALSDQKDFDRPLTERGLHDAPEMARRLLERPLSIDAFVSSPAERARQTATLMIREWKKGKAPALSYINSLYLAEPEMIERVVMRLDNGLNSVAIVSHNPGITDFVNRLTSVRIDHMPTCAVYAVRVHTDNWKEFSKAEKEFLFFDYPKNK